MTTKPTWATIYDRSIDVSDCWMEATDPENEFGEECTVFMDASEAEFWTSDGAVYRDDLTVTGIAVTDSHGTTYYDREWTVRTLGMDWIWRIEQHEMEAA